MIPCWCKHFGVLLCQYILLLLLKTFRWPPMDENFANWSASSYRAGRWFSSSLALGADIVDKLFSDLPCNVIALFVTTLLIQCGPITHSSTGSKPDSLVPFCSRGYSSCLTSYEIQESSTLWYSVRYQTQCLCLMLWTPFHRLSSASNACIFAWNFS